MMVLDIENQEVVKIVAAGMDLVMHKVIGADAIQI